MRATIIGSKALGGGLALAVLLAGCAIQPEPPPQAQADAGLMQCEPAGQGEPLIGNWMGVRKQQAVSGELRVAITLRADGTMTYQEQLKRGRKPAQTLNEAGCWTLQGSTLTLQTTESNGTPVDANDPIYRNQYAVQTRSADRVVLQNENGALAARRMPPDYRLPAY